MGYISKFFKRVVGELLQARRKLTDLQGSVDDCCVVLALMGPHTALSIKCLSR